ncbi:hypothetical protein [Arthrobacter sp. StoSoilB5]|uniref:CBU_0592 family membrane protein n=1 Tax=Arthrobacter sp. StoSoilB5 TaxID=2830992 RepID=UPI001E741CFA|nr:hypothetical protein StoSoilB5_20480 [Arthrobacter sp. StoSoilB5]
MELLWEVAGWAGSAATLSAYLAVSMDWLKPGRRFQAANLLGACAFMVNGAFHQAWPSVVTNIAWVLISTVALLRMRLALPAAVDAPKSEVSRRLETEAMQVETPESPC